MDSVRFREKDSHERRSAADTQTHPLWFLGLILISIVCLSHWGVRHQNPIADRLSFLITPVRTELTRQRNFLADQFRSWREVLNDRNRMDRLEKENEKIRQQLSLLEIIQSENFQFRRLHHLTQKYSWQSIPAIVIGRGEEQFRTLLLNRGFQNGIRVNQPVITYNGLVGRVFSVQPYSCRVLQITDPNSSVGVFVAREPDEMASDAVFGVISGLGKGKILLELKGGVEVPSGYSVYTSSISTIYPSGLPVGTVSGLLETGYSLQKRLQVDPKVDFERLREVLILIGLNRPANINPQIESLQTVSEPAVEEDTP